MNMFKYPFPARRLCTEQSEETNIEFAQELFTDGRPFHVECWAENGATHLTFFFSNLDIEHYQKADIIRLLNTENAIDLIDNMPCYCGIQTLLDDSNHSMFTATVTIGDENNLFVDSRLPLNAWHKFMEGGLLR